MNTAISTVNHQLTIAVYGQVCRVQKQVSNIALVFGIRKQFSLAWGQIFRLFMPGQQQELSKKKKKTFVRMGRVLQYSFLPPFPAGPCQVKNGFAIFHVVRSFYSTIDSQNKRHTQTSKQKRKTGKQEKICSPTFQLNF